MGGEVVLNGVPSNSTELWEKVDAACQRIAPLWPLDNFVAVNPYLGLSDQPFWQAHEMLRRLTDTGMCMPRDYYAQQIAQGRISRSDLTDALQQLEIPWDIDELEYALSQRPEPSEKTMKLVVDIANEHSTGEDWTDFVVERISRYCAAYFDRGQALWPMPWKDDSLYGGWVQFMRHDKSLHAVGLRSLVKAPETLPTTADEAIAWALQALQVPAQSLDEYLHAVLLGVGGWASWTRYLAWQANLEKGHDESTRELLAIRLVWEVMFYQWLPDVQRHEWHDALAAAQIPLSQLKAPAPIDAVLQTAFEIGYQKRLMGILMASANAPTPQNSRPQVEAVFCIDVRSETYRRALEAVTPQVKTRGFAGFFGILMEYVPLGAVSGHRHHPVLFNPSYRIQEGDEDTIDADLSQVAFQRQDRLRTMKTWKLFKTSASSGFAFVEASGLLALAKIITDSLSWTRPVPSPDKAGLDAKWRTRLGPVLSTKPAAARLGPNISGIPEADRPAAAEFVLRNLGLTDNFPRLVVFVGHGSTTVNNPQGTALDCGACGGRSGEASAKIAALLLNDPVTRQGLVSKGIRIPDDTYFSAALHDTATDDVTVLLPPNLPSSHHDDAARFGQWAEDAGQIVRLERAASLNVTADTLKTLKAAITDRIKDWAQVRPEWALAGNAAFIAAPRRRTVNANFSGRTFLHDYDWHHDDGFSTLELIMTGPLMVAQWINMQYYGSMVDHRHFGSGNKVLHNVVGGAIGVLEGNGGDLRVGLSWQSLHNGQKWMHEPLRLTVLLEAPTSAIDDIIARHSSVRDLVDNGWIHLFQIDANGDIARRTQDRTWRHFVLSDPDAVE